MPKYYLSIDLDYWYRTTDSIVDLLLFHSIFAQFKPKIVDSHEKLVPHINKLSDQFNVLVNLDFHSDLASLEDKPDKDGRYFLPFKREEGTWGNFVSNSLSKTFIWSPPAKKCISTEIGLCHGEGNKNPFKCPRFSCWKFAKIRPKFIPNLSDCVGVGIAESYPYWTLPHIYEEWKILKEIYKYG